jgi:hypothetical protein
MLDLMKGTRLQGNVVVMVAAGVANAVPIFQLSNFAAQIGTKTFRLKRVKGLSLAGANTDIHIGTGAGGAFVAMIPPLHTFNGLNFDFVEDDLPEVEFAADMTCYPDVAAALTPITIQVEVEEIG